MFLPASLILDENIVIHMFSDHMKKRLLSKELGFADFFDQFEPRQSQLLQVKDFE
jgi:hypothetical protein